MSKESRRRQRAASQSPNAGSAAGRSPDTGTSKPAAGSAGPASTQRVAPGSRRTERVGRRERVRYTPRPSFVQRYRTGIVGLAVVAAIALVGLFVFTSATQSAYACSNEWQPSPTTSPAAGASPHPGNVQPDMGNKHVAIGTRVTYTYCPPASGSHYIGTGIGPIKPRVYGPADTAIPEGWVHNLEHGALLILYRGDGPGATDAGQAALRDFYATYPASPVCGLQPGTQVGPVFVRFDNMAWPYAAMVWGRVLPLQTLDTTAILDFDKTYGERTNPEIICPNKYGSLPPGSSAVPSSEIPSTLPNSASPSAAPSSAAPSTAPSQSAAPSAS